MNFFSFLKASDKGSKYFLVAPEGLAIVVLQTHCLPNDKRLLMIFTSFFICLSFLVFCIKLWDSFFLFVFLEFLLFLCMVFLFSFHHFGFELCHCLCLVLWELPTTIELSYNFEPLLWVVVALNAIASISSPSSFTFSPFLLLWVQFVVVILCFPLFTCASFGALKLWTLTSNLFLGGFFLIYFFQFLLYILSFLLLYILCCLSFIVLFMFFKSFFFFLCD